MCNGTDLQNVLECISLVINSCCFIILQVSKMQSTTEEENRLSELITSETRRSTLGTVLQTVVNYGRPSSAPSSRGKEQLASISEKRSPIASPAAPPLNFGRGLCCMFIQFRCTFLVPVCCTVCYTVRTGLTDHLKTLNADAHDLLRSYVLRIVVHKVQM